MTRSKHILALLVSLVSLVALAPAASAANDNGRYRGGSVDPNPRAGSLKPNPFKYRSLETSPLRQMSITPNPRFRAGSRKPRVAL